MPHHHQVFDHLYSNIRFECIEECNRFSIIWSLVFHDLSIVLNEGKHEGEYTSQSLVCFLPQRGCVPLILLVMNLAMTLLTISSEWALWSLYVENKRPLWLTVKRSYWPDHSDSETNLFKSGGTDAAHPMDLAY